MTQKLHSTVRKVPPLYPLDAVNFWRSGDHASWWILIIKPTRRTNFSNLFLEQNSTYFRLFLCPSSGLFTIHTTVVYVIQVCWQLASGIRTEPVPSWSCSQAVSEPIWYIPLLCAQWKTPGDGQRNCPKHVEFYSKNKFEKLVHLVGFIIRI